MQLEGGITFVLLSKIAWLIAVVRLRPALSIAFLPIRHCDDKMLAEGKNFTNSEKTGTKQYAIC